MKNQITVFLSNLWPFKNKSNSNEPAVSVKIWIKDTRGNVYAGGSQLSVLSNLLGFNIESDFIEKINIGTELVLDSKEPCKIVDIHTQFRSINPRVPFDRSHLHIVYVAEFENKDVALIKSMEREEMSSTIHQAIKNTLSKSN